MEFTQFLSRLKDSKNYLLVESIENEYSKLLESIPAPIDSPETVNELEQIEPQPQQEMPSEAPQEAPQEQSVEPSSVNEDPMDNEQVEDDSDIPAPPTKASKVQKGKIMGMLYAEFPKVIEAYDELTDEQQSAFWEHISTDENTYNYVKDLETLDKKDSEYFSKLIKYFAK